MPHPVGTVSTLPQAEIDLAKSTHPDALTLAPFLCTHPCTFLHRPSSPATSQHQPLSASNGFPFPVGYAQSALDADYGAVMTSAQFTDVASADGSISLSAIKPTAAAGVDTGYLVEIQILDNAGYTTEDSYLWNGSTWEAATGVNISTVTFAPGQGLWVMSSVGDVAGLQSSGKVGTRDVDFALDEDYGAVAIGNPFPTALSLEDIVPIVGQGVDTAYLIEIQILDNAGYTTESSYLWNGASWEAASGADVSTITFDPGQGLWVMSSIGASASLRFPAPEL